MTPVTDVCPFCPRLCRHVCPVVGATAKESATPTAIATVLRLEEQGKLSAAHVEAALGLCNGCGACARHCAVDADLPGLVRSRRPMPVPARLPVLPGAGQPVRVRVGEGESVGVVVYSPDALGHANIAAGDRDHARRVARHFVGRRVATDSNAVAEVIRAASRALPGSGIELDLDRPRPGSSHFVTCWEGATGTDGQLACCGAREGFERSNPDVASAMAQEVVRRTAGEPTVCSDGHCAAWLRAHGGQVEGPDADRSF